MSTNSGDVAQQPPDYFALAAFAPLQRTEGSQRTQAALCLSDRLLQSCHSLTQSLLLAKGLFQCLLQLDFPPARPAMSDHRRAIELELLDVKTAGLCQAGHSSVRLFGNVF